MKPRTAGAVVLLAAVAWVVTFRLNAGQSGTVGAASTPASPAGGQVLDWADTLTAVGSWAVGWVSGHPQVIVSVIAALVLVGVVRAVRAKAGSVQDPQRMYTSDQRQEMFARAGGQCEYTGMFWWSRCRRPAEHADHLYPWSRGGATTLENGVASCASHNTSKGAKILPRWKVRVLVRRRRRYFPPGVDTAVGQKYADVVAARGTVSPR